MTAAALHPFLQAAERDLALFGLAHVPGAHLRGGLKLLLGILVLPGFVVLAQIVPFVFRRHLALVLPSLPHVDDANDLASIRDVLVLYYASLKEYARFTVFRRRTQDILDDLDEQIDSLQYVVDHKAFLDSAVARIEQR